MAAAGAVAPEGERHARGGNGSKLGHESSSPGDHDGPGTKIPVRGPRRARRGASRPFVVASHAESGAWQSQRAARAAPRRTGEGRRRAPLPMRGRFRQVRDGAELRNSAASGRRHEAWALSYQAKAGRAARLPHPDESVGARNDDGYEHHTNEAGTTASEAMGRVGNVTRRGFAPSPQDAAPATSGASTSSRRPASAPARRAAGRWCGAARASRPPGSRT